MNTTAKIFTRVLTSATIILMIVFLGTDFTNSSTSSILGFAGILFILGGAVYSILMNRSKEEINDILGITIFKKIGCDFSKE